MTGLIGRPHLWRGSWWAALGLIALVAVGYGQTLWFDFVWDDRAFVPGSPLLRGRLSWSEVFASPQDAYLPGLNDANKVYRPLVAVTLAADHAVWGLRPGGFHLGSVLLHLANVLLLWRLAWHMTRSYGAAFAAGALLAVHPSAVEAATFIVGARADLLAALGMSATLLLLRGCLAPRGKLRLMGALVCFAIALGSKETAVVMPAIATWVAWVYPEWFAGPASRPGRAARALPVVPFWIVLGLYGALRWAVVGGIATVPMALSDVLPQTLHGLVGIATYGQMTLVPLPPTGYIRVEPAAGFADWRVLLGIAWFTLLVGGLLWLRHRQRAAACALGWYAAALLPPSNLVPIYAKEIIHVAERSLYPALTAWCLFVAVSAHALLHAARWSPRARSQALGRAAAVLLMGTFLLVTAVKATVWTDDVTLWTASTITDPGSAIARSNLANALARVGRLEEATAAIRETEALFPTDGRVAYVAGWIAEAREDTPEAQRQYERAIALGLRRGTAYRQAAALAARQGEWDRAGQWFAQAAALFPKAAWPHVGLAWYRQRQGRADLARIHRERAKGLDPKAPELEWFLGKLYAAEGQVEQAVEAYHAALVLDSSFLPARSELASMAEQEGRIPEAIALWQRIALDMPAGIYREAAIAQIHRLEEAPRVPGAPGAGPARPR